jgi:hypothetical protein
LSIASSPTSEQPPVHLLHGIAHKNFWKPFLQIGVVLLYITLLDSLFPVG